MASITSQLIVSLIDGVSGPARRVSNSLRGITRTVKEVGGAPLTVSDRLSAAITRNDRAIEAARGRMLDAVGTLYLLKNAIAAPVQAAQDLETALAGLGAKGNLSAAQLRAIGDAAKQTSGQVNQFTTDIIKAQDFLVGMGLDVDRSTKAMPSIGKAATATGASLEDLSKAGFAAMSNLGVAAEDLARSFDIMAQAGKDGGFELRDMAQYLPSITAMASAKGMKGQEGLSQIAAALQIVRRGAGDSAEAATNFNNILQKINSNDAIKNFKKKGIDIQKVLKDAAKKGADPLEAALRAINKAIKGDTSRIGELFSDAQVQKGLIPLLNGLNDYIELRDKASKADGVVDKDFARMMQTGAEKMKSFQIAMQNLATGIGNALIPVLGDASAALRPIVEGLTRLVNAHPRIAGALIGIAAGFIALKAAMNALAYVGLMGKGGVLSALAIGLRGVTAAMTGLRAVAVTGPLAALAGGFIRLRAAIAGLAMLGSVGGFSAVFQTLGSGLLSLLNPMRLVTAAAVALRGAIMLTGVGAVLIGIAMAGKFIYDNWSGIKEMFVAFGKAFSEALGPVKPLLDPVISGVSSIFNSLSQINFEISPARWAEWGAAAGKAVGEVVRWFAELPGRIIAAIGSIDIASMIRWPTPPAWLSWLMSGGGSGPVAKAPNRAGVITGARARGGPISRGSTYMVGERGPELITAGRSGYVNKAGGGGAGGINVSPVFNMTFNGKADAEDVVQQIRRVLRDEVRETFRGVFADTSMRFA